MKNPFRINWNAYFYQYNLLAISKRLAPYPQYNWMTFWANDSKLKAIIVDHEDDYLSQMSMKHAIAYQSNDTAFDPYDELDKEEEENTILSRLSLLQANDILRG